jgi:hypothetical protein
MFDPHRYTLAKMVPRRLESPFWTGHVPFAFALVETLRPNTVVELGTYSGSSLAAFCQAVEAAGLDTQCYGVDTWEGDAHISYDESVYRQLSQYVESTYPGIAHLVRARFEDAVVQFADQSIDLLHIDGTHTYEAVSGDYHTWLPKVSDRGVVLFHDTNVTAETHGNGARNFGVRRLFDELKTQYSHFEFTHSCGLGVLLVGQNLSPEMNELLLASKEKAFNDFFARLGNGLIWKYERSFHGLLPLLARRAVRAARRLGRTGAKWIGPSPPAER